MDVDTFIEELLGKFVDIRFMTYIGIIHYFQAMNFQQ